VWLLLHLVYHRSFVIVVNSATVTAKICDFYADRAYSGKEAVAPVFTGAISIKNHGYI